MGSEDSPADSTSDDALLRDRLSIPIGADVITGSLWHPAGSPAGVVVVHPATATPERFYRGFAEYLNERGLAAVTYDYRGTGQSGSPKDHQRLRMRDWMDTDVPAVARWTRDRFPDLPISALGHSIGGHALVLGYGTEGLQRFALVSSHEAATREISPRAERLRVAAILNVIGPALSRTMGYFPGKLLGLGEDMPSGSMIEWGRWARNPRYFFDDPTMNAIERSTAVTQQILGIGASDDPWASPAQIDALTGHLTAAAVERRTFTPEQLGVARIGHHGLLRRKVGTPVWPELVNWLTETESRS